METKNVQRIKLLKLWEILQLKTDVNHQLTTNELILELSKYGISCERRTLYRDIETLIQNGYDIQKGRSWHDNTYYVDTRSFTIPEIKITMDAIQSASFIPDDKTETLINKLAELSGSSRAEFLKKYMLSFKPVKHRNDNIYKNIELIEQSLESRKRIKFYYFRLNENHEKIYSHNKKLYSEEPLGVVLDDGNYYLMCYRTEKEYINHVKVFRIDRMDNIIISDNTVCKEALRLNQKLKTYKLQVFKMYGGEVNEVTLQFSPELVGVIYDKFGYDTKIRRVKDDCRATVKVQISPTFWGWMMQFPTKMKIYSPENLKQQYIEWVKSAL